MLNQINHADLSHRYTEPDCFQRIYRLTLFALLMWAAYGGIKHRLRPCLRL